MTKTSPREWMKTIAYRCPAALGALVTASGIQRQLLDYQAAALFELVHAYVGTGAHILEIGTLAGYSAAIMAQAAADAEIVTLNAAAHEIPTAIENLLPYPNVQVRLGISWDILPVYDGPELDVVFVDGDHRHADRDVPWFNHLAAGGLMLFHDYTPVGSRPVVVAVRGMARTLGRYPDVLIEDGNGIGMAGFYRRMGERV